MCLTLHLPSWLATVIDHGIASVEVMMEEALQDIPSLVKDIQERLRRMEHLYSIRNILAKPKKLGKYMSKQKHCMSYMYILQIGFNSMTTATVV